MPWNEADRAKYDVIRERYSSDLSDAEFALIFPLSSELAAAQRRLTTQSCLPGRVGERLLRGYGGNSWTTRMGAKRPKRCVCR